MEQRFLIDSNTIIDYVGNKIPEHALPMLDGYFNEDFSISIIAKIEVLGFNAEERELTALTDFIGLANIIFITESIADKAIEIRKSNRIKLPDAIIAATAFVYKLTIISRNISDFKNIDGVACINPWQL